MDTSVIKARTIPVTRLFHKAYKFALWWGTELRDMLPKRIRSALLPQVHQLYLEPQGRELQASLWTSDEFRRVGVYTMMAQMQSGTGEQELAELAARSREVVLCLPPEKVLQKSVTLPLAAEENLYEVLGFEMDRQTPFSASQVCYDFIITDRNPGKNTLTLDILVTPSAYLDELLTALGDMGLRPDRASIRCDQNAAATSINLLPIQRRRARPDSARHINLALAALALLLLLAAVALPITDKYRTIQALESRIQLATGRAEAALRLDEAVKSLESDSSFLTEKKLATPMTLEVINELTRILPDSTWINRLSIRGSEIQLQGQSAAAAELIPLLESSDIFGNPRFRSPVTRVQQANTETFYLSAEVTGATPHD